MVLRDDLREYSEAAELVHAMSALLRPILDFEGPVVADRRPSSSTTPDPNSEPIPPLKATRQNQSA